jgi:glutamine amidotransferase
MSHINDAKIGIIDYGLGNIFSIKQALRSLGIQAEITKEAEQLESFDGIILPGVGAFGEAMQNLKRLGLDMALVNCAHSGLPILGICLGLQLLMTISSEFGLHQGLGLIEGRVERFPQKFGDTVLRIPFIGWNRISVNPAAEIGTTALKSVEVDDEFYFVHSYFALPKDNASVLAYAEYDGFRYPVALKYKNVFATQFHPEKSGMQGLSIFSDWVDSIRREKDATGT